MNNRPERPSWLKRLRQGQRQVEDIGSQAEESIDKHLFRRFDHLLPVKRFIAVWVGLMIVLLIAVLFEFMSLGGYFQSLKPVPGGIYSEGLVGSFTNANPIYATSDADETVANLIFSGLLKTNNQGNLVGNLASSYSVDATQKIYTVNLKPNLKWQDGRPLTANDVVFTFDTIQNPDAQSPLFSSWQGIKISAPNSQTVVFKLPDVLASFPYELTTGILPEHILAKIPASDLRSAAFNTSKPVGSGPFEWQGIQVENGSNVAGEEIQIALNPFTHYAGGSPKLDQFMVQVYPTQQTLVNAFKSKDVTAMEAATPPVASVQDKSGVVKHNFILRAANMAFFKTTSGVLADQAVRQALVQGVNVPKIVSSLEYKTPEVNEPLLQGQLAYNPSYAQSAYDVASANKALTADGWLVSSRGIRYKANAPLSFTLTAEDNYEDQMVANELKGYWQKLGVQMNIQLLNSADYQSALSYHDYDAILAAISIGKDPDVFVYWDSSQADVRSASRLNFSEFNNPTADEALESGRTRLEPALRVIKYQPFLQAWQQQAPAVGLYQPRLLYLTHGKVSGLTATVLSSPTDRFNNVQNWEIREAKVTL
jgi:peptide/nickel transport system substrate-binding protein